MLEKCFANKHCYHGNYYGYMEFRILNGLRQWVSYNSAWIKWCILEIGDLQIHSESYDSDSDITNTIKHPKETLAILDASKGVQSYAPRFKTEAFARSARGQQGIKLLGVYPEKEHEVLELETRLQAGTFFRV